MHTKTNGKNTKQSNNKKKSCPHLHILRIKYLSFNPSCPLPVFAYDECRLSPKWFSVDNALSSHLSSLLLWTVCGCVLDFGNSKSLSSQMDPLESNDDISVGEGGREL
jgi:hypothetical protein